MLLQTSSATNALCCMYSEKGNFISHDFAVGIGKLMLAESYEEHSAR